MLIDNLTVIRSLRTYSLHKIARRFALLFNILILLLLLYKNKILVSADLAKIAYNLNVRKIQGLFLTLLVT